MDLELARQVLAAKALARRNRTRRNRIRAVGLLTGMALAGLWFLIEPDSSPEPGLKLLIGLVGGFVLADLGIALWAARLLPEQACCPTCGHDWEIREGRVLALEMPTWDRCPGCGLPMSELTLLQVLKRGEPPAT